MNLPEIASVGNIEGKRVLLRVDFNVPVSDGEILDTSRIQKSLKTINFIKGKGAIVTIISHIESGTLLPVSRFLYHYVPHEFLTGSISEVAKKTKEAQNGKVFLLENLRLHSGEEENSQSFSEELASLGDIFVNEAFSVSHRKHASVVGLPKFIPAFIGFQFVEEIVHLSQLFNSKKPFVLILGGAKLETKIPLLKKFLTLADSVYIVGMLANNFFLEKGLKIGLSKISKKTQDLSDEINNSKLHLPIDVVVSNDSVTRVTTPENINSDEKIVDVGPETILEINKEIKKAETILWSGPLGNYEAGFEEGTKELAHRISEYKKAYAVVGGGDTAVLVYRLNLENKFDFVSTGSSASLEFLTNETLPGIEAISDNL